MDENLAKIALALDPDLVQHDPMVMLSLQDNPATKDNVALPLREAGEKEAYEAGFQEGVKLSNAVCDSFRQKFAKRASSEIGSIQVANTYCSSACAAIAIIIMKLLTEESLRNEMKLLVAKNNVSGASK